LLCLGKIPPWPSRTVFLIGTTLFVRGHDRRRNEQARREGGERERERLFGACWSGYLVGQQYDGDWSLIGRERDLGVDIALPLLYSLEGAHARDIEHHHGTDSLFVVHLQVGERIESTSRNYRS